MWLFQAIAGDKPATDEAGPSSSASQEAGESTSVLDWLDVVKPGYGERFSKAFDAVGIEDTDDFRHMDDELFEELEAALRECGAKAMHLSNIQRALFEVMAAEGCTYQPAADEQWEADPTWKCEFCDFFGSFEEVSQHEATCPASDAQSAAIAAAVAAGACGGVSCSGTSRPPKAPKAPKMLKARTPKPKAPSPSALEAAAAMAAKKAAVPAVAKGAAASASAASSSSAALPPSPPPPRAPKASTPKAPTSPPARLKRASSARVAIHSAAATSRSEPPPASPSKAKLATTEPTEPPSPASARAATPTKWKGPSGKAPKTARPPHAAPLRGTALDEPEGPPPPTTQALPWWCDVAAEGCLRPTEPTRSDHYSADHRCWHLNHTYMVCEVCYRAGRAEHSDELIELPTGAASSSSSSSSFRQKPRPHPLEVSALMSANGRRLTSVNALLQPSPPRPPRPTAVFASESLRIPVTGLMPLLNQTCTAPPPSSPPPPLPPPSPLVNPGTSPFVSLGGKGSAMPSFGGGGAGGGGGGAPSPLDSLPTGAVGATVGATDDAAAQYAALEADIATFVTALPLDNAAIAPFTFATPPAWLVSAAAYGCRDLADVAKLTSLEHQGPIDALEQPSETLAEYNRWLLLAAKRVEYLQQKQAEARRARRHADEQATYAQRGAALQQKAWEQRGQAAEAERRLAEQKRLVAAQLKHAAAARKADAEQRGQLFNAYVSLLHEEVLEGQDEAREAKAAVAQQNAALGSTLRAASGALERKKGQLQAAKEAEARKTRDRVREAGMVLVPPEIARAIARSSRGGLSLRATM